MTATTKLDAIEARVSSATPGPWTTEESYIVAPLPWPTARPGGEVIGRMTPTVRGRASEDERRDRANADLAAHARTDLPLLLSVARATQRLVTTHQETAAVTSDGSASFDALAEALAARTRSWGALIAALAPLLDPEAP